MCSTMYLTHPSHQATATDEPAVSTATLPAAILAQAQRHPERIALVHDGTQLTYGELIDRARHLAAQLQQAGVGRETTVALCLERTPALVVAILGVWFAGGACLMMDPAAPPLRRDHMLHDSGTQYAVTQPGLAELFSATHTLVLLEPSGTTSTTGPSSVLPVQANTQDVAYLIYTSGTTGLPKGVMVEHAAVSAMADSMERTLHTGAGHDVRRVALNGGTSADPFFADFANLAYGRTLVIVDEATRRDPERLARLLDEHQVELLDGTPTQIRGLLLACGTQALRPLRILILGSEPIDSGLWQQLRSLHHLRTYNYYGPTETTVYVTGAELAQHPEPIIGTALPGNRIWVVDTDLQPVPDGQLGEICVTGRQLARGYLNPGAAEQTRFTTLKPPGEASPVRAYRTGDRGRYNAAGQIEFHGRFDNQVSISGYRVELGEVEAALRSLPGVSNATVTLLQNGDEPALTGWVVLDQGTSLDQVRASLARRLPPHMLPRLNKARVIPMSPAGKADISVLSAASTAQPSSPAVAPRGQDELAQALHALWSSALGISAITDADDFFVLGGNSLKATQMIVATREQLALDLPIRTIFDHPRFDAFHQAVAQALQPTSVPQPARG